ncbi:MAG: FkbM family methyltransferase [Anaerolineae bacterium]|nr:FkbM family methyltransferase [Anaerolineae bacterium]MDW8171551.1 FkbM family methyltransferase [Anaerolineae bacterium]
MSLSWTTRLALMAYGLAARLGLTETRLGRRLFLWAYSLYKRRAEARHAARLLDYIPPDSTVIDVGANVGFFTRLFARHLGQGGRVIAIEPETRNAADLRAMLAREGLATRVTVVQALAADQEGERLLALDPLHPANHRIGAQGVPTPARTLDSLVSQTERVSLIKIDVQGAELLVLHGAQTILRQHKPALYVEVSDVDLRRFGTSAEALLNYLAGQGYAFFSLGEGQTTPLKEQEALAQALARGYADVLCLAYEA